MLSGDQSSIFSELLTYAYDRLLRAPDVGLYSVAPRGAATSPPPEEGVIAWSRFLAPRRTFAIFGAHLGEACAPMKLDFKWRTKAVLMMRHGLARAEDRSFSPRPVLASRQLLQTASQRGLRSVFAFSRMSDPGEAAGGRTPSE